MEEHSKKLDQVLSNYFDNLSKESNNHMKVAEPAATDTLLENPIKVVHAISMGIPYKVFNLIKRQTPFTDNDWAKFLSISKRSLDRFKAADSHIFKSIHSEKIFEIVEVTKLGYAVFDGPDDFYDWLNTPSFALGNYKPTELLSSSYGKELVVSELHSIDHGIFV